MNQKLVLFAHPYFEHSQTNVRLVQAYQNCENVTFRDLYEEYPDFNIQAFRERKRLVAYDTFIIHFPLIWFGMPPLLKLWIDEVFDFKWLTEYKNDNPISGKNAYIVVTVGGTKFAYSEEGRYEMEVQDYLRTLTECIKIAEMKLEDFIVIYNADNLTPLELEQHYSELRNIVIK